MMGIPVCLFHPVCCTPWGGTFNLGSDIHFYVFFLSCFFEDFLFCAIFSNSGNHTVVRLDCLDWFINHVIFSLLLYISLSLTNLEKIGIFWRFSWSFLFYFIYIYYIYFYNISITKSSLLHLNVPFYGIFFLFNWYSTFSYCSKNINDILNIFFCLKSPYLF